MSDRLGLPRVIADIAACAGIDAARALAAEKGGQEVYIPGDVSDDHWLAQLVGLPAAKKICAFYRAGNRDGRHVGRRLLIPMANVKSTELLVRAIEAGDKNNRIAAMTGKHERTVRRMRSKLKSTGLGPLFD